ncbi:dnaJ-like protein 60 [Athalia rosae]|uniref:dnaJ-like protein 60 n=1 Tax=Athalia rosae TaxID=37344 RepID=UPI002034566E|nr:dnaJ-like protein 60 [Athalia rosae]
MYKILRVNVSDLPVLCRCYGTQRKQPNHYETLCIEKDSTQKEIRDAFIKLSKKLHPDMGMEGNHAKFVKVNEAYKILSKELSRRQYDMELKYRHGAAHYYEPHYRPGSHHQRAQNYYYYDDPRQWASSQSKEDFENNYYGIKGVKRVSNTTIAMMCVLVFVMGSIVQGMAIKYSFVRNQQYLQKRHLKAEEHHKEVRANAINKTRKEQLTNLEQRYVDAENERIDY